MQLGGRVTESSSVLILAFSTRMLPQQKARLSPGAEGSPVTEAAEPPEARRGDGMEILIFPEDVSSLHLKWLAVTSCIFSYKLNQCNVLYATELQPLPFH